MTQMSEFVTYLVLFLITAFASLILTPRVRKISAKRKIVDKRALRKVHTKVISRLGGAAIYSSFFLGFIVVLVLTEFCNLQYRGEEFIRLLLAMFIGGTIIAGLGLFDDIRGVNAKVKLLVQVVAALIVILAGFRIKTISNPFGQPLYLDFLTSLIFTVLWIVALINAINLIDGLDGLAAGVTAIASLTVFCVAITKGNTIVALLMVILAGALIGFLRYNFHPAKIFMGDTGSMFIGFAFACISIVGSEKSATTVALLIPVLVLGVPIFDAFLSILRRTLRGTYILRADRGHIHHQLMDLGLGHRNAVLVFYGITLGLGIIAYSIILLRDLYIALLLGAIALITIVVVKRLKPIAIDLKRRQDEVAESGSAYSTPPTSLIPKRRAFVKLTCLAFFPFGVMLLWFSVNSSFDKIGYILDYLERHEARSVVIAGKVKGRLSVPFVGSSYKIADGTGEIWVVSRQDDAPTGNFIWVKGDFYSKEKIRDEIVSIKFLRGMVGLDKIDKELGPILLEKERGSLLSSMRFLGRRL